MDYIVGLLKIANLLLALVAGVIAANLFRSTRKKKELKPWTYLIIGLILFVVQEILGALRAFQIFESPYLTHIVPTILLAFLIIALIMQINIHRK